MTHRTVLQVGIGVFSLVLAGNAALAQTVWYVDDDAPPGGDGTTWLTAYSEVQDALDVATSGSEIRVAAGTYTPAGPGGDRTATFQLISGVGLYGGYAGLGAPDPDERDIGLYETILSGDLNGDDGPDFANNGENSYHVVRGRSTDATAVLDGFTITGGNAEGSLTHGDCGGGFVGTGDATLKRCVFRDNQALDLGGGLALFRPGQPTLIDCTIHRNRAENGGGLYAERGVVTLTGCTFVGNSATKWGGGVRCKRGVERLIQCTFSGNTALHGGALASTFYDDIHLINCTLQANSGSSYGGGMTIIGESTANITNCIYWGNSDPGGSDQSAQIHRIHSTVLINFSCVQGWIGNLGGIGNMGAAPLFVDAYGTDDIPGTEDDDLRLLRGSPCIDAGDNTAVPFDDLDLDDDGDTTERTPWDLDGGPRFINDPSTADTGVPDPPDYPAIVDMGVYEAPMAVNLDIKPGGCPNSFNRNSQGVLPVALAGTEEFDVTWIDLATVKLARADGVGGSVSPHEGPPGPHSVFKDVATPFEGEPCDCHELEGDGVMDLSMKFETDDVVDILELNDLDPGALVELAVTGELSDGTPFFATDCVRLVPPGTPPGMVSIQSNVPGVWVEVDPLDNSLDGGGFADFERSLPLGTVVTLTAQATANGQQFRTWRIDGVMQPAGQTTVQAIVTGDVTAKAVYRVMLEPPNPNRLPTGSSTGDDSADNDDGPMMGEL